MHCATCSNNARDGTSAPSNGKSGHKYGAPRSRCVFNSAGEAQLNAIFDNFRERFTESSRSPLMIAAMIGLPPEIVP